VSLAIKLRKKELVLISPLPTLSIRRGLKSSNLNLREIETNNHPILLAFLSAFSSTATVT
jgi:hypothetical protein